MFVSNAHTDKDIDETLEKVSLFFAASHPGISRRVNTVQSFSGVALAGFISLLSNTFK